MILNVCSKMFEKLIAKLQVWIHDERSCQTHLDLTWGHPKTQKPSKILAHP